MVFLMYVSTLVKGTFGYFDPHYYNTGQLTRKSDVYAFGVVLLEVLCRKRAVDRSLHQGLVTWAQDSIKEGRVKDIVDSDIIDEISTKSLKRFTQIVEGCLENHPKNRPTMTEVVLSLQNVLTLQENSDTKEKTVFGRMVDKLSFRDNVRNLGVEFGSLMPRKPHRGLNIGFLMPKKRNATDLLLKEKLEKGAGSIKVFRAEEVRTVTMYPDEIRVIGEDRFGIMYWGILPDSRKVTIKRFEKSSKEGYAQFVNEVEIFGQISHRNVLRLLGCYFDNQVMLLVFEYAFDLYQHIHGDTGRLMSWDSRLRLTHESATALAYLHSDATRTIIHRNVKLSNILWDERCSVKISGFGFSKLRSLGDDEISTEVVGTRGYVDPEYLNTGHLSDKCDVYSFGVVLAELLTGLEVGSLPGSYGDRNLSNYFASVKSENRLHEIIFGQVVEEANDEELQATFNLMCRCVEREGRNRPSMKEISIELERIRKLVTHSSVSQNNNKDIRSRMIESEQSDLYGYSSNNSEELAQL